MCGFQSLGPSLGGGGSRSEGYRAAAPHNQLWGEEWGGDASLMGLSAGREKSIRPHGIRAKL